MNRKVPLVNVLISTSNIRKEDYSPNVVDLLHQRKTMVDKLDNSFLSTINESCRMFHAITYYCKVTILLSDGQMDCEDCHLVLTEESLLYFTLTLECIVHREIDLSDDESLDA